MRDIFRSMEIMETYRRPMRPVEEIIKIEERLENILEGYVKRAHGRRKMQYVLPVAERKVGKSYAVINVARRHNFPIVVSNEDVVSIMKRYEKQIYGDTQIQYILIRHLRRALVDGMSYCEASVIMIDEDVDAKDLQEVLSDKTPIVANIIGIC